MLNLTIIHKIQKQKQKAKKKTKKHTKKQKKYNTIRRVTRAPEDALKIITNKKRVSLCFR